MDALRISYSARRADDQDDTDNGKPEGPAYLAGGHPNDPDWPWGLTACPDAGDKSDPEGQIPDDVASGRAPAVTAGATPTKRTTLYMKMHMWIC